MLLDEEMDSVLPRGFVRNDRRVCRRILCSNYEVKVGNVMKN